LERRLEVERLDWCEELEPKEEDVLARGRGVGFRLI
jgi:hypothetical protein